ncbi:Mss4-like protein [Polychytrium aggregatum]|uniref:Mss4-like protein n=1 Tax=Polychytrium aggregatum TaxID=110093 RepID=UPI0022FE0835|nr:Mss4-like protein [Polychytrium aggregatum]KAI9193712.1 Mss4-like protein [Polychytrium aggregatum]
MASENIVNAEGTNALDIYCPRPTCHSIVLKRGAARNTVANTEDVTLPALSSPLRPGQESDTSAAGDGSSPFFWSVANMMVFENVGFSKPVADLERLPEATAQLVGRFLCCADCDEGPLGYESKADRKLWIASDRVSYR